MDTLSTDIGVSTEPTEPVCDLFSTHLSLGVDVNDAGVCSDKTASGSGLQGLLRVLVCDSGLGSGCCVEVGSEPRSSGL